jgi:glycosyltransferase involved in cell wall biosynthesis
MVARPAEGGLRRHVGLLCAGLASRGVAAGLCAPRDWSMPQEAADIPVWPVDLRDRPSPVADLRAALAVARLSAGFPLIHGHGARGAWIAALAATLSRKPYVVTAHNLARPLPGLPGRLLRFAWGRATGVVAVSAAVAATLEAWGAPMERIRVIPNGVPECAFDVPDRADARRRLRLLHRGPLVAAAGRLAREKGFATLLAATARLAVDIPDVRVVIAGAGPERDTLAALATSLRITSHIDLCGSLDGCSTLFAAADVVVAPSLSEGQGMVALEAMAAGRPVVASRVGGLVETVQESETGILTPPSDAEALYRAVAALLRDRTSADAMGRRGREVAAERYTLDGMCRSTAGFYEACLQVR